MNIYSILDFGAKPSETVLQTEYIQAAIDKCYLEGGGIVNIPSGTYLTGAIRIRSNIELHLEKGAKLLGSRNPEDYFCLQSDKLEPLPSEMLREAPWMHWMERKEKTDFGYRRVPGSRWNCGLIKAVYAENVTISGEEGSVIDGNDCYDEQGEEHYRGPHGIHMFYSKNITLCGYNMKNASNWAHTFLYCNNIKMYEVVTEAGHDGFDAFQSRNIKISNCKFYTGDDCIAGFANTNVHVVDTELNSACSALRFGGVKVLIERCHMYGPCKYLFRGSLTKEEKMAGAHPTLEGHRNNMLSAFTYYADASLPESYRAGNIVIKDCSIDYADRFLHYNFSGNEVWQREQPLESIKFENIKATDVAMPLTAYGSEKVPIVLKMKNIDISFRKGCENQCFMKLANYKIVMLKNIDIKNNNCAHLIQTWSDRKIKIKNLKCLISKDKIIERTNEEFFAQSI
ncbi:MAG: glycosyl hydrolase family 28 protein [Bacillota bacterium]|nr:glycosyl hydrolase family 28 protein [Bacillota bacterium]